MRTFARVPEPSLTIVRSCGAARGVVLPPRDRPHWHAPAGNAGPLLYLAWGARQFGVAPIAARRHDGWLYALVEEGHPTLVRDHRAELIPPGTLLVIGPDCAYGWRDESTRESRLLVWLWRAPVHGPFARLPATTCWRIPVQPDARAEFRRWHALTRGEVHRDDAHAATALSGVQRLLETRIARYAARDPQEDIVARAMRWSEAHLATRQPLARLADFLGLPATAVHRLFREQLGTTVRRKFAELRCREAERLFAGENITIKEVAYRLGYRHPHDFTRAFRNYAGVPPTRLLARERTPALRAAAA